MCFVKLTLTPATPGGFDLECFFSKISPSCQRCDSCFLLHCHHWITWAFEDKWRHHYIYFRFSL